jgi:iron complex transport system substrate-binding protein
MNPLNGTKVPGQAERPATLTADALGDALALGLTPVVASEVPDYMKKAAHGVRVVKYTDLSGIRAATPDVILGSKDFEGDEYGDLMKIAPTILTDSDDWKLNLREHGEALGRTNDAEALLTDWDNRVARVKRMIGDQKIAAVVSSAPGTGEFDLGPDSEGGSTLADVGILVHKVGQHPDRVIHISGGAAWNSGGVLGARARLADIANAL